jgi:hypothetical protein
MDEKHSTEASNNESSLQALPSGSALADARSGTSGEGRAAVSIIDSSGAATSTDQTPTQSGAMTVVQVSRVELDRLLAETQKINERSWQVIHEHLNDAQVRVAEAIDSCLAHFEKEVEARTSNLASMMLQNFEVEAGARLTARLDQAFAGAKEQQRCIEQDLALAAAENRNQFDQLSTGAANGLREHEQSLLRELRKEAEKQLRELGKKANELSKKADEISNNMQSLGESLGAQLKQRTEETIEVFQSRSEQVWRQVVERGEQQIAETVRTCTTELTKQAREVVGREMSKLIQALGRFRQTLES